MKESGLIKVNPNGTVAQLEVHTWGGVIEPAKTIMTIVPAHATLVADVKVLNRDIGFVHAGHSVAVKLEAFPFTRYGALMGHIQRVAAYAVADEKLGLVYPARILLERPATQHGAPSIRVPECRLRPIFIRVGGASCLIY